MRMRRRFGEWGVEELRASTGEGLDDGSGLVDTWL